MKQLWTRYSIKVSMVFLFLGISLVSLILMGILSHVNYSKAVKDDFYTVTDEAAKRLNHHMEFYFEHLAKTTRTLMNTELIQSWFEGSAPLTIFEIEEIEKQLRRHIAFNYTEVAGIFIKSLDQRVLAVRNYQSREAQYAVEPWFRLPFSEELQLIPTHTITYPQQIGMSVISMVKPVYSTTNLQPIGSVIFDLSLDEIDATFSRSRLGKSGQLMMLSPDDTIVYHPVKEWRGRSRADTPLGGIRIPEPGKVSIQQFQGEKLLISTSGSGLSGWSIVAVVPFDEMASGLYSARNATFIAFLIIAIIVVLLVPWVSNWFVAPVLHLKQNMTRVAHGDYSARAEEQGLNEFQKLNFSFNRMVEQLHDQLNTIANLKVQEIHTRLRQKEAFIQALQNQINPHLLYNSLDVIKSIGYIHHDELVVSMAGNLADIYRYTAKSSDMEVTLKEELEILEKYLEITHIRFPKKFQSRITVHPKFHDCLVVKLTVQPLVENAVKYAVEPRGGNAAIIVSAYDDKDDLVIEIADNGEGIPEAKMAELTERLEAVTRNGGELPYNQSGSLGITNVHTRLHLNYGEGYGLCLSPFEGRGTVVSIRIPMRIKR